MTEVEHNALSLFRRKRITSIQLLMSDLGASYQEAGRIISNLEDAGLIGPWRPGGVRLISDGKGGWI